jgi:DNA modification methylase
LQVTQNALKKKFTVNDIICADSKNLSKHVAPNSVALTVTSPPYRNAINYSQHVKNARSGKNKSFRGNEEGTLEQYLLDMEEIFAEVNKVTIPGGYCCIVIADELFEKNLIPLPSMLASRLLNPDDEENGWYLRDMIIWNKVTAGRSGAGNRFGQFIKIPVPTRYRANIMHEQIIILQKGKDGRRLDKETEPKVPINRAMKRQVANSIWDITPVPPNAVKHPAPFPEQIPWRLISLYTEKGDVVLDPMCGSGQTTKVAKSLGRKFVGVDLRKEYVSLSKKRLKEKPMLSNFIIPLYFPVRWHDGEQSGRKQDAHLDIEQSIPKGFRMQFQKTLTDKQNGTDTTQICYKNKAGDYLASVIGSAEEPYIMNLGNPKKKTSVLGKIIAGLPKTFDLEKISSAVPKNISDDPYAVGAVIDVLEHAKVISTGARNRKEVFYRKK